ncbi:DAK2 domain-containing protein [Rhodococcus coprophilus]|uniref:Glycerone kinase family protein n=1 Tax=Rhodococcus coprophilus TaxID=38310 RepID=A0A2X4WZ72_9NOCA|nr:DAK2 domain-containing protein [Rhodococcus coprophilus]MBM7461456.1 DAK2 domain fusion protein YloV [Rhodococcus coprophilus]SQI29464.1 glycerone kinase family protein [Rhodococcus coprophilus]
MTKPDVCTTPGYSFRQRTNSDVEGCELVLEVGDTVGGRALRRWAEIALQALEERRHEINTLNVFPVPDGDTGTNLVLTLQSAVENIGGPVDGALTASDVSERLARGAFLGARGNSGVIVAQALRGVADAVAGHTTIDGRGLADALRRASKLVMKALSTPEEGTIVSVLEAAAEGAEKAARSTDTTVCDVTVAAADAAADALQQTPAQLDVLAEAGVVDAGGLGLVILLDCLVEITTGQRPQRRLQITRTPAPPVAASSGDRLSAPRTETQQDYEVMYVVERAEPEDIDVLRVRLDALGDSVAVVGDGAGSWSVHVHCCDPGAAVEAGLAAGSLIRIDITCFALGATNDGDCAVPSHTPAAVVPRRTPATGERAVLAVVAGHGARELFESEGASVLHVDTDFGPGRLLDAVRALPSGDVLVLPNGSLPAQDVVAVGAQARSENRNVMFLPSSSMVQGLAALAVHDPGRATVDDAFAMSEAAAAVRWGSLRVARERALTWVGQCEPGDSLGLSGHDVVVIEHDLVAAGVALLDKILAAGGELVTMLVGADAPAGLAEQLTEHLDHRHPALEVVVYRGGQRSDLLQLGVE